MSSEIAVVASTSMDEVVIPTIIPGKGSDEAYEPTYQEAFPPLPASDPASGGAAVGDAIVEPVVKPRLPAMTNQWNKQMSVRSSVTTQVFCVPLEERRYKEMSEQQFGEKGTNQAKICLDIINRTGVAIEMSLAKDLSLTVVITGKPDTVMRARKMVVQQLQTQAHATINIPKEHYRFILGPKGKRLADLELNTATKIQIPRPDDNSNTITITGTKEGLEKARHEIQCISDEQAKLAFERLPIPKIYHAFINGPDNKNVKALIEQTGARISVPPPSVMKDEVVVAGEKEGVFQAKAAIMKIFEEKRKCQTVSVEVRKSQHKYVIGPRGSNLSEILEMTGVSVEVPSLESNSETITLRGDQDKLGPALTLVYAKANSVVIHEVEAPAWLHKFIIGRKGVNVRKITQDLNKVHIEFTDGQDRIVVEGPPEEVAQAEEELRKITKDLISRMAFAEIDVDQKYHRHIIGRQGANVTRLKNETGVSIRIPADTDHSRIIRIEGSPEGVAQTKNELLEMVHKMENEKSRDILLEQRFHKTIIGAAGSKIKELRDRFPEVQIMFPDSSKKSDVVQLRGPKNDVDKCHKYMQQMHLELIANNFVADVHIFKQFHKNIIGKGGANIRKIRDDTETRIDLPSENSTSDVISITGKRENVLKARDQIEAIQKELANIKEMTVEIPHRLHNSIIGAKGRLIRSIMDDCGGVLIRFPPEGGNSDKVIIRGPKDDVEKARKQLTEQASERKEQSFSHEVRAKPEYHKFLIGRGGTNIKEVRERTGARIIFPSSGDQDQELITIIGRQSEVDEARTELESRIKDLENITELVTTVDPKHHRHFVARRGEVLRHIAEEYGGVTVSFPRSGVRSDKVTLKGAKDCVEAARDRILEIANDLESQVTIECVIPQKYHRTVMGAKGYKVQEVTRDYDVAIKFPDRPNANPEADRPNANPEADRPIVNAEGAVPEAPVNGEPQMNGDAGSGAESGAESGDTPKSAGDAPQSGGDTPQSGGDTPQSGGESPKSGGDTPKKQDVILVTGKKENCEAAQKALMDLVPITEEVEVAYDYHRFIIGQKGKDVRNMMMEFDVNISIPPADAQSSVVRITGTPNNTKRATVALMARVEQLEGEKEDRKLRGFTLELRVDPIHHPKIIGRRGAVISKIREEFDVNIQFPDKGSAESDLITVAGYEDKAAAAKEAILKIVHDLEDQTTEEVPVDHRIHSRIIGARGRAVRKIMDDFKVDIKFPLRDASNPDIVIVTGAEDNVLDCKDHLLNLEEEYLQDVIDQESMQQYMKNTGQDDQRGNRPRQDHGYSVRNAPWSASAPDTSSTMDFPELGTPSTKSAGGPGGHTSWGPPVKR